MEVAANWLVSVVVGRYHLRLGCLIRTDAPPPVTQSDKRKISTNFLTKEVAGQSRVTTVRETIFYGIDSTLGFALRASQVALFFMIAFILWPSAVGIFINYVGLNSSVVLLIICGVMFIGSPLLLFSGAVGMWRCNAELSGGLKVCGIAAGVFVFAQGYANAIIPIVVLLLRDWSN